MTHTTTTRFDLDRWSAETDSPNRSQFDSTHAMVEALGAGFTSDVLANRPAAGKDGWFFWAEDTSHLYYDNGAAWVNLTLDFGVGGDIDASVPGDTSLAGSTGKIADAGHRHGRESWGAVVALTKFGLATSDGAAGRLARADHSHGTPVIATAGAAMPARSKLNFVIPTPLGAVADDGTDDETTVTLTAQPGTVPFHVNGALTTGLKKPKWIAPVNCTLTLARAVADVGSGVTYQLYVNGAAATATSAATGTAVVTNDFTDVNLNAGDTLAIDVISAGTGASDLSVTVVYVPR